MTEIPDHLAKRATKARQVVAKLDEVTPIADGEAVQVADLVVAPTASQAWNQILADLPGIGKDNRVSGGAGGYTYRGIEQITAAAAPLFGKYGVSVLPRVVEHHVEYFTAGSNNTRWADATLVVDWYIYGPAGDYIVARTIGLGRDNSDKSYNKAMSQSFKYLLLPGLMVSDKADEGDHERPEVDGVADDSINDAMRARYAGLMGRAKALKEVNDSYITPLREAAEEWQAGATVNAWGWANLDAFEEMLTRQETIAIQDGSEDEPG